jgi:hypothetical protein
MKIQLSVYLLLLALFLPLTCSAEDATISGLGGDYCGKLLTSLDKYAPGVVFIKGNEERYPASATYFQWIRGYIAGYNIFNPAGKQYKDYDGDSMAYWFKNYCIKYPFATIMQAAQALITEKTGYKPFVDNDNKNKLTSITLK